MLEMIQARFADGKTTYLLFDGRRKVAIARPKTQGAGHRITGYGLCLLDKEGGPTVRNKLGIVDPTRAVTNSHAETRRFMERLAGLRD